MLIRTFQDIAEDLEDKRAATVLTAIDFAKAFNRLSYQHCLRAFALKGASTGILRLLATFLSNRKMSVRIGSTWLKDRDVTGGCPQGSILRVYLFNVMVDDLEDAEEDRHVSDEPDIDHRGGLNSDSDSASVNGSASPSPPESVDRDVPPLSMAWLPHLLRSPSTGTRDPCAPRHRVSRLGHTFTSFLRPEDWLPI